VRSLRDPVAGTINIRAKEDITVIGNRILNTNRAQTNYGAVAVKLNSANGRGGKGDVVVISHEGRIIASDRAFDFENRFNELNAITLLAKGNIELSVTDSINADASNNSKSVVSTRGGDTGQGGTNTLRSYTGSIVVGTNAQVLSDFAGRPGSNGTNTLISCGGVTNNGTVTPSDANTADDSGVCTPNVPSMISCSVAIPSLWLPNYDLVNVGFTASTPDNCSPNTGVQVMVFSDEDDEEATGDGNYSPDAKDIAPSTLRLRSERKGDGDGRVYLIVVRTTDAFGSTSVACSTVVVPKSQSQADINSVNGQAQASRGYFLANSVPPQGYHLIGDGPIIGSKQ
jgi:hypothetical protein